MDKLAMTLGWITGRRIAGQRTPAEPWELLFEGDVTTEAYDGGNVYYALDTSIFQPDKNAPPDTERIYRLTVDGASVTQIAGIEAEGFGLYDTYYIGNMSLWHNEYSSNDALDDGTDFCIFNIDPERSTSTVFCSRIPGTYRIKVERLLKDPVAYSYNGTRFIALPTDLDRDENKYFTMSVSGAARLLVTNNRSLYYNTETKTFRPDAYVDTGSITAVTCYIYDPTQGHTDWVRYVDGDAELAWREEYPISGETLIWSNKDVKDKISNGTVVLEGSRAMPIFDYKEW